MEGVATKQLGRDTLRPHRQKFDILITKIYNLFDLFSHSYQSGMVDSFVICFC